MNLRPWTKGPWDYALASEREHLPALVTKDDDATRTSDVIFVAEFGAEAEQDANVKVAACAPDMAEYIARHAQMGDPEAIALWQRIMGDDRPLATADPVPAIDADDLEDAE